MLIPFTKMHACGNDYIYLDGFASDLSGLCPASLAKKLCCRRFSVGADGIVLLSPSQRADGKMRIFNADGSEGRQCGNALRCVGRLLFERGYVTKRDISIETASGICPLRLALRNGCVENVTVCLGRASFDAERVPILAPSAICDVPLTLCGRQARLTCVSMGNPHGVLFFESIEGVSPDLAARELTETFVFPEGVNVEIAEAMDRGRLRMRVFERGSGETLSCGTGAAATAVSAVHGGLCDFETPIAVSLLGGALSVTVARDDTVFLTGEAVKVYEGVYEDVDAE